MSAFDYRTLDDVIHARIRLGAMALLASVESAEFTHLRDSLATTDGNLSTHLARLIEAGYVEASSDEDRPRRATLYRISASGRHALRDYMDRMDALLGGIDP